MKTNRIHVLMSDEELAAIDKWRFDNHVGSRGEAVRRLCAAGAMVLVDGAVRVVETNDGASA